MQRYRHYLTWFTVNIVGIAM